MLCFLVVSVSNMGVRIKVWGSAMGNRANFKVGREKPLFYPSPFSVFIFFRCASKTLCVSYFGVITLVESDFKKISKEVFCQLSTVF